MHTYIHAQTQAYIHASCVYFYLSSFVVFRPGPTLVYHPPSCLNSYGQDAWDDPQGVSDEAAGNRRQHDGHEEKRGASAKAVGVGAEGKLRGPGGDIDPYIHTYTNTYIHTVVGHNSVLAHGLFGVVGTHSD